MRDLPATGDKTAGEPAKGAASPLSAAAEGTEPKKDNADGFLSREAIEKARAACHLELKGATALRASAEGGLLRVAFSNSGTRSCFMGMQSDKAWATARGAGLGAVEVEVQPNPTSRQRTTRLVIATALDRWTLSLTQAAGAQDVEELELDQEAQ